MTLICLSSGEVIGVLSLVGAGYRFSVFVELGLEVDL